MSMKELEEAEQSVLLSSLVEYYQHNKACDLKINAYMNYQAAVFARLGRKGVGLAEETFLDKNLRAASEQRQKAGVESKRAAALAGYLPEHDFF
jgi:hypothetical protein